MPSRVVQDIAVGDHKDEEDEVLEDGSDMGVTRRRVGLVRLPTNGLWLGRQALGIAVSCWRHATRLHILLTRPSP